MNKFEKRNEAYKAMQEMTQSSVEIRYIDGVLCINNVPVTDQSFIDSQELMFLTFECDCDAARRSEYQ